MKQTSFTNMFQKAFRQGIRNPKYRWFIILGTLFYLASPVDIAPDAVPILGWVDDGVLATLLISEVCQLMIENSKSKNQTQAFQTANAIDVKAEPIL
ncbi:MAG: DUF1232 domain-containing protein [Acaryochloris sp. RU_4_1]|nr:DUF1232 domain-containing protein [Acaryochloris sp. SU_5_25]NJM66751.1 DUF1232 domain-containing protein [Acaryochloris sp. RU_4_1]NJN38400.1 DUF1232 domain-containing protein [Acaryochloridaceae cyanobacterium CSU_3_4]NJR55636.1 DUF1232 domain-containing protein [Acaryochloris sp. CRU_2_0]